MFRCCKYVDWKTICPIIEGEWMEDLKITNWLGTFALYNSCCTLFTDNIRKLLNFSQEKSISSTVNAMNK